MAMNPLPPQAYTKETLQKAYSWLLNQSPSIKEMASNQEILVSLYLKAQRDGDASLEAPSIQNFKQELKSLASMIGDFQTPQQTQPPKPLQDTNEGIKKTGHYSGATSSSSGIHAGGYAQPGVSTNAVTGTSSTAHGLTQDLDPVSLAALLDVRNHLNLSSDVEALRALIAIGHRQFRKIIL